MDNSANIRDLQPGVWRVEHSSLPGVYGTTSSQDTVVDETTDTEGSSGEEERIARGSHPILPQRRNRSRAARDAADLNIILRIVRLYGRGAAERNLVINMAEAIWLRRRLEYLEDRMRINPSSQDAGESSSDENEEFDRVRLI